MYFMPSDEAIARLMKETGFDRLVAIRHLQQRHELAQRPQQFPLGKSQYQ